MAAPGKPGDSNYFAKIQDPYNQASPPTSLLSFSLFITQARLLHVTSEYSCSFLVSPTWNDLTSNHLDFRP